MANHASAEKRNRQRIVRTARNKSAKSSVRTLVKRVRTAVGSSDKAAALNALKLAASALDRAAGKGILHTRTASRTVARLSAAVAKLSK